MGWEILPSAAYVEPQVVADFDAWIRRAASEASVEHPLNAALSLQDVAKRFNEALDYARMQVVEAPAHVLKTVSEAVENAKRAVGDALKGASDAISNAVGGAMDAARNAVGNAWNTILNAWEGFKNTLAGVAPFAMLILVAFVLLMLRR